jgi:uncharacterized protein DUF3616
MTCHKRGVSLCPQIAMALTLLSAPFATAEELGHGTPITFRGDISKSDDISGITRYKDWLIVCADEGGRFDVLKESGPNEFRLLNSIPLLGDPDLEIDLEGAAFDGHSLYLIGSHSLARKSTAPDKSRDKNIERMTRIGHARSREAVFRIKLDEHGQLESKNRISLSKLLKNDPILGRFTHIPGKENGVDIEGIATAGGYLYVGFRGPVLRGNYVPVLVMEFDSPDDYELRYVNLRGRGIRDITAVHDGFLIIAGPVGGGDDSFRLCFWNGKDCVEGTGGLGGDVRTLATLSSETGNPEGLAVFNETAHDYSLVVVYDGAKDGGAMMFTVAKAP